ncbi:hypothetical protein GQ53DRAFT_750858 [Thozetella sp. PMI_491]|nr:hypothetical protein GQ53DRAFT_750858 [Thozetella sp. PMI_491]
MQTVAIIATLLAAASASPLAARDSCNVAPTGSDTSVQPISSPSVTTADLCRQQCAANPSCKAFVFGLPANANAPICELFAVPASQIPAQQSNLNAFDSGCSNVPNQAPTADHPQGLRQNKRDNQCGATPAGPSSNSPSPLQTTTTPGSLQDCLNLCKTTAGCQSVEYGSPTAGAPAQCILFSVPVSSLPPPASGASIQASDVGC